MKSKRKEAASGMLRLTGLEVLVLKLFDHCYLSKAYSVIRILRFGMPVLGPNLCLN